MEEAIILGAKKALKMLGIDKKENSETIFSTEGIAIPFNDGMLEFDTDAENFDKIVDGSECKVVWDGVEYVCPATVANTTISIGDRDGNNNAIPFWINARENGGQFTVEVWADTPEPAHTIDLYLQTETITPIDPKYLPDVCLPVVELSAPIVLYEAADLSESESAAASAIAEMNIPFVLKFQVEGFGKMALLGYVLTVESETVLASETTVFGITMTKALDCNKWGIIVTPKDGV